MHKEWYMGLIVWASVRQLIVLPTGFRYSPWSHGRFDKAFTAQLITSATKPCKN